MVLVALLLVLVLLVIMSGSAELLILILILGPLFIILILASGSIADRQELSELDLFKRRLSAYEQLSELDLFKRRLSAYEQLKSAVRRVGASGAVSNVDIDRFAQAMSDMRFLFDKDLERFVSGIYDALLKKHALDALLKKAADQEKVPTDQALIDKALRIEPRASQPNHQRHLSGCAGAHGKVHASSARLIATWLSFAGGASIESLSSAPSFREILSRAISASGQ